MSSPLDFPVTLPGPSAQVPSSPSLSPVGDGADRPLAPALHPDSHVDPVVFFVKIKAVID